MIRTNKSRDLQYVRSICLRDLLRISIEMAAFQYCFLLKKRPFHSKFAVIALGLTAQPTAQIDHLQTFIIFTAKFLVFNAKSIFFTHPLVNHVVRRLKSLAFLIQNSSFSMHNSSFKMQKVSNAKFIIFTHNGDILNQDSTRRPQLVTQAVTPGITK